MKSFRPTPHKDGAEKKIEDAIRAALTLMEWLTTKMHGNEFQMGIPDLYCIHRLHGQRWIEVKNPERYSFTNAQYETFPLWTSKGVGIWILTSAEPEELQKLFQPANWWTYLYRPKSL